MKVFVILVCLFTFSLDAWAQLIIDRPEPEAKKKHVGFESAVFVPDPKLLDTERWTRVSAYRFECEFLRLAVEFRDHNYVLLEMDGAQRILAKSIDYRKISQRIVELTLNPRPNLDNFH